MTSIHYKILFFCQNNAFIHFKGRKLEFLIYFKWKPYWLKRNISSSRIFDKETWIACGVWTVHVLIFKLNNFHSSSYALYAIILLGEKPPTKLSNIIWAVFIQGCCNYRVTRSDGLRQFLGVNQTSYSRKSCFKIFIRSLTKRVMSIKPCDVNQT